MVLTTEYSVFTPPAYPDTTEPPILIVDNQSRTRVMKWDEENATLSEAYVSSQTSKPGK